MSRQFIRANTVRSLAIAIAAAVGSMTWGGAAKANIVVNGDFETGSLSPWNSNGGATIDSAFPNSGTYDAAIGGDTANPATLDQLLTTTAGQAYTLDFFVSDAQAGGTFLDSFQVNFGGFSSSITGDQASSYTEFLFAIPGTDITSATTDLLFTATNFFFDINVAPWNLDDVSVSPATSAVPEPGSIALLGSALAAFGFLSLRRRGNCKG